MSRINTRKRNTMNSSVQLGYISYYLSVTDPLINPLILSFYLVVKRLLITKNSIMKFKTLTWITNYDLLSQTLRALVKLRKTFFILLQKLFSFSRKSKFRILDIQISWRHQISKHKKRNTFYWIYWEVNTVC